jgi:hypothetical protein
VKDEGRRRKEDGGGNSHLLRIPSSLSSLKITAPKSIVARTATIRDGVLD